MIWQDIVIMIGQVLFSISLIPILRAKTKPPKFTCFLTASILGSFFITFGTLSLWMSMFSCLLNGTLWCWIGLQKGIRI